MSGEGKTTKPAVFIGCLASYNEGEIYGDWLNLDDYISLDDFEEAVAAILKSSPAPLAEEYMVQDHEGYSNYPVSEYEPLANLHKLGRGILVYGEAYAIFCTHRGEVAHYTDFREAYCGVYDNIGSYGENLFYRSGGKINPKAYINYFNFEDFARDKLQSDFYSERGQDGLHVFRYTRS